jgi:Ca2+/Na+ antiporter
MDFCYLLLDPRSAYRIAKTKAAEKKPLREEVILWISVVIGLVFVVVRESAPVLVCAAFLLVVMLFFVVVEKIMIFISRKEPSEEVSDTPSRRGSLLYMGFTALILVSILSIALLRSYSACTSYLSYICDYSEYILSVEVVAVSLVVILYIKKGERHLPSDKVK